jgi:hypothetical protein
MIFILPKYVLLLILNYLLLPLLVLKSILGFLLSFIFLWLKIFLILFLIILEFILRILRVVFFFDWLSEKIMFRFFSNREFLWFYYNAVDYYYGIWELNFKPVFTSKYWSNLYYDYLLHYKKVFAKVIKRIRHLSIYNYYWNDYYTYNLGFKGHRIKRNTMGFSDRYPRRRFSYVPFWYDYAKHRSFVHTFTMVRFIVGELFNFFVIVLTIVFNVVLTWLNLIGYFYSFYIINFRIDLLLNFFYFKSLEEDSNCFFYFMLVIGKTLRSLIYWVSLHGYKGYIFVTNQELYWLLYHPENLQLSLNWAFYKIVKTNSFINSYYAIYRPIYEIWRNHSIYEIKHIFVIFAYFDFLSFLEEKHDLGNSIIVELVYIWYNFLDLTAEKDSTLNAIFSLVFAVFCAIAKKFLSIGWIYTVTEFFFVTCSVYFPIITMLLLAYAQIFIMVIFYLISFCAFITGFSGYEIFFNICEIMVVQPFAFFNHLLLLVICLVYIYLGLGLLFDFDVLDFRMRFILAETKLKKLYGSFTNKDLLLEKTYRLLVKLNHENMSFKMIGKPGLTMTKAPEKEVDAFFTDWPLGGHNQFRSLYWRSFTILMRHSIDFFPIWSIDTRRYFNKFGLDNVYYTPLDYLKHIRFYLTQIVYHTHQFYFLRRFYYKRIIGYKATVRSKKIYKIKDFLKPVQPFQIFVRIVGFPVIYIFQKYKKLKWMGEEKNYFVSANYTTSQVKLRSIFFARYLDNFVYCLRLLYYFNIYTVLFTLRIILITCFLFWSLLNFFFSRAVWILVIQNLDNIYKKFFYSAVFFIEFELFISFTFKEVLWFVDCFFEFCIFLFFEFILISEYSIKKLVFDFFYKIYHRENERYFNFQKSKKIYFFDVCVRFYEALSRLLKGIDYIRCLAIVFTFFVMWNH